MEWADLSAAFRSAARTCTSSLNGSSAAIRAMPHRLYGTKRRRNTPIGPNSYVIFLFFLLNFGFILEVQSKPGVQRTSHNMCSGTFPRRSSDASQAIEEGLTVAVDVERDATAPSAAESAG